MVKSRSICRRRASPGAVSAARPDSDYRATNGASTFQDEDLEEEPHQANECVETANRNKRENIFDAVEATSKSTTVDAAKTDVYAKEDAAEKEQPIVTRYGTIAPPPKFQVKQRVYARDQPTGSLYDAIVRKIDYAPKSCQLNVHSLVAQHHQDDDDEVVRKKKDRALDKLLKKLDPLYEKSPDLLSDDEPSDDESVSDEDDEPEYAWHYFVHYQGWNVRWDRWLDEDSLYQDTPGTRALVEALNKELKKVKALSKNVNKNKREEMLAIAQKRMRNMEEERREAERWEESRRGIGLPAVPFLSSDKRMGEREEEVLKREHSDKKTEGAMATHEPETLKQEEIDKNTAASTKVKKSENNKQKKDSLRKADMEKERKLHERDLEGRRKQSHAEMITLPFTLKKVLVDEWEVISQCRMVHNLPAEVTVKDALRHYLESKLEALQPNGSSIEKYGIVDSTPKEELCNNLDKEANTGRDEASLADGGHARRSSLVKKDNVVKEWESMVDGLATFFDQALPVQLLYRHEVPQLASQKNSFELAGKRPCEIYGCEYLLRLFVRFPALLAASNISESERSKILFKIGDFVRFVQKHQAKFFLQNYRKPTDQELLAAGHCSVVNSNKKTKRKRKDTEIVTSGDAIRPSDVTSSSATLFESNDNNKTKKTSRLLSTPLVHNANGVNNKKKKAKMMKTKSYSLTARMKHVKYRLPLRATVQTTTTMATTTVAQTLVEHNSLLS